MSQTPGLSDAGAGTLLMPWLPEKRYERPRSEGGVPFELVSAFGPAGDQPQAIAEITEALKQGERDQVLLGVTGSGKTFTIAHVIQNVQRPTLVLAPNKTLAAQLYGEMKSFFPERRGRVFRLLLRLLPAGGLRPAHGHLYREGRLDQRADRPHAPFGDAGAARAMTT